MYPRVTGGEDVSLGDLSNFVHGAQMRPVHGGWSVPFPDFITSARRELIPSEDFLVFFVGAISAIV